MMPPVTVSFEPAKTCATPKSVSLMSPSGVSSRFEGLRSRWMIPASSCAFEGQANLDRQVDHFPPRNPLLASQPGGERFTRHVFHRVVVHLAVDAMVEQLDDVRVLELLQRVDLPHEAGDQPLLPRQRRRQQLERDDPASLLVTGQVDRPHAARAKLALDQVRPDSARFGADRSGRRHVACAWLWGGRNANLAGRQAQPAQRGRRQIGPVLVELRP